MTPETSPPPESGSGLSPAAQLYLASVLVFMWLAYVLPSVGLATAAVDLPLAGSATVLLATLDPGPGSFLAATIGSVLIVAELALTWAYRRSTRPPGSVAFPWDQALVFAAWAALAVPAEWCGGDLVPDLLSVGPVVTVWLLVSLLVPFVLLVASVRVMAALSAWLWTRPFAAGLVAGMSTICLAAPAGAAVGVLALAEVVEAAQHAPAPLPAEPSFVVLGAPGTQGESLESEIEECFRRLAAERSQVQWVVRSKFRLSEEEAEDVAGQALLSVCTSESLSTYQNLGGVYQEAAKNRAKDVLKRKRGEPLDEAVLCLPFLPDQYRLDEVRMVDRALEAVDPTTRAALLLSAEGHSHDEIAYQLGLTNRQSRDRVGNGLKKLRRVLDDSCLLVPSQ